MKVNDKITTIKLPTELHEQIAQFCRKDQRSVSSLFRKLAIEHLEKEGAVNV
ncbi:MAG: hypothetical protein Kow00121_26650 [Elainellaceae cyanobacterium]